jgi:hypothetical protein
MLKIREEIAEKRRYEYSSRHRPMIPPRMTWKEKRMVAEENMVADGILENTRYTPTYMDIDKYG